MATRFHFQNAFTPAVSPAFVTWTSTASAVRRLLTRSSRSSAGTLTVSDTVATTAENCLVVQYVSYPLWKQTISGTLKGQIAVFEANAAADDRMQLRVYIYTPAGAIRAVLYELDNAVAGNEFALTTATNRKIPYNAPVTLTPADAEIGDFLVVELGFRTTNTTATAYSTTWNVGDPNGVVDLPENETATVGNGWIEFSADLMTFEGELAGSGYIEPGTNTKVGVESWNGGEFASGSWPLANTAGGSAAVDLTDPVITNISPGAGLVAPGQAISFRVTDETILKRYFVFIKFSNIAQQEVAWDGSALDTRYAGSTRSTVSGGYDVTIRRDVGWSANFDFKVVAIDAGGNVKTSTTSYTVATYLPYAAAVPAGGTALATPTTPIVITVIDPTALVRVEIEAIFATLGRTETIYDGAAFKAPYLVASSLSGGGTNTRAFTIVRTPGWPEGTTLRTHMFDEDGNVTTQDFVYTLGVFVPVIGPIVIS